MAVQKLNLAIDDLEKVISDFPVGASDLNDLKPIDEKISDIRESLIALNARRLTLKAMNNVDMNSNELQSDFLESFKELNETTTNYLLNCRTLKLCHQRKAIENIISKTVGMPEIQAKVKFCLKSLFLANDQLIAKNGESKKLMNRRFELRKQFHHTIYNHQEFLQEREARKNQQLQETNPEVVHLKDKINKSLAKTCIVKKLIINLIASMSHLLEGNKKLVELLSKHKKMINFEDIMELTKRRSSESSGS